jgi:hypothetical protein
MNIVIYDIKNRKERSVKNVKEVQHRGHYFKVIYKNDTSEKYSFKLYDVFQNR